MQTPTVTAQHMTEASGAHNSVLSLLASILTPGILQEAIDSLSLGVVCFDLENRLVCFNQRYTDLLELPAELLQRQPSKTDIVAFQRQRGDFDPPGRFFDANGHSVHPDPVTDELPEHYWRSVRSGKTLEVTVSRLSSGLYVRTFNDVSAYFQAHREAQRNAARLQRILDATDPGTWEMYLSSGRVEINSAWARTFGHQVEELQPMSRDRWRAMIHPEDVMHTQAASLAFFTGTTKQFDSCFRMRHKAGHWIWVRCAGKNYEGVHDDGSIVISGTLFDVSDQVAAQELSARQTVQLKETVDVQYAQLERSVRDMAQISAGLAHDLRTPLRSINGYASILGEESAAPRPSVVFDYSQKITKLSGQMGRMISGILELLQVLQQPISLQPLRVSDLARKKIEELNTSVCVEVVCGTTPVVQADPILLDKVLENLIGNALAHSRGSSSLRVEIGYSTKENLHFVHDNGSGFDMNKVDQLGMPFTRLQQKGSSDGIGMGLAIASRCVERMGGRLQASSSLGAGSTFSFSLELDDPS